MLHNKQSGKPTSGSISFLCLEQTLFYNCQKASGHAAAAELVGSCRWEQAAGKIFAPEPEKWLILCRIFLHFFFILAAFKNDAPLII